MVEYRAAVRPWLGDSWRRNGEPFTEAEVRQGFAYLSVEIEALDMIAVPRDLWCAGASA